MSQPCRALCQRLGEEKEPNCCARLCMQASIPFLSAALPYLSTPIMLQSSNLQGPGYCVMLLRRRARQQEYVQESTHVSFSLVCLSLSPPPLSVLPANPPRERLRRPWARDCGATRRNRARAAQRRSSPVHLRGREEGHSETVHRRHRCRRRRRCALPRQRAVCAGLRRGKRSPRREGRRRGAAACRSTARAAASWPASRG